MKCYIKSKVLTEIKKAVGRTLSERGGYLGMDKGGKICAFLPDEATKRKSFVPNEEKITEINSVFAHDGIEFAGIVQSRAIFDDFITLADKMNAKRIFNAVEGIKEFSLILVITDTENIELKTFHVVDVVKTVAFENAELVEVVKESI